MIGGAFENSVVAAFLLVLVGLNVLFPKKQDIRENAVNSSIFDMVGHTPIVRIASLSGTSKNKVTVNVFAKLESCNPTGSSKDRVAMQIIKDAERSGELKPYCGMTIYEGTSGSTGISLASFANVRGYKSTIVMPDDQSPQKYNLLHALGATVIKVKPSSISNPDHYVNVARKLAQQDPLGYFANQFENLSNFKVHYTTTAPEIYTQFGSNIDYFVMSGGTCGTISGISCFLKEKLPQVQVILADCEGSSLSNLINHGTTYAKQQREVEVKRHRYDTLVEGIGIDRITSNLKPALDQHCIDFAIRVSDEEVVEMASRVARNEGLIIGSSSALNLCCCEKIAESLKNRPNLSRQSFTIVTIICSSGLREAEKLFTKQVHTS